MTIQEKSLATIRSSLAECDKHRQRLDRAQGRLASRFPIPSDGISSLDEDAVTLLDQFIYRFMKLQDSMGTRLLPSIHAYLQDSTEPKPFLDILSDLEKFGVIPSENSWQFFRNLRNSLAHDYPESAGQTVITLNTLYEKYSEFTGLYLTVRAYCDARIIG